MGRRIRLLGVILVVCLGLVIAQLVNIQLVKAPSLRASVNNPGNQSKVDDNNRGNIYLSDGTFWPTRSSPRRRVLFSTSASIHKGRSMHR